MLKAGDRIKVIDDKIVHQGHDFFGVPLLYQVDDTGEILKEDDDGYFVRFDEGGTARTDLPNSAYNDENGVWWVPSNDVEVVSEN